MNVGYISKTGCLKMIVDSDASTSKVSKVWLRKYVKEMEVNTGAKCYDVREEEDLGGRGDYLEETSRR